LQIILYFLLDNSSNLPPLQDDREEFQLQTEDILRERFKLKKLLDGNSEIHLLPWIWSRYFKSTRRDKIYFIASQQVQHSLFAFIPITSDFILLETRKMFSVFIFVALLKYRVPKQFYDDLVNSSCFIICFNYCILFSNYISNCLLSSLSTYYFQWFRGLLMPFSTKSFNIPWLWST